MALEAQDNLFPYMTFVDTVDPATPSAGQKKLWVDTDDALKLIDESGTVTTYNSGGGIANPLSTDSLWDAAGDLVQGTGANTAAKLGAGLTGQVLRSAGAAAANVWAYPPAYEFDYAQITSPVNVTGTSEAAATTIVTGSAVTYDGSTVVIIEFWAPYSTFIASQARDHQLTLYDGSSSIGIFGLWSRASSASNQRDALYSKIRLTPTAAAHTYSIRGFVNTSGTWVVGAGAGGSTAHPPAFIRITKV